MLAACIFDPTNLDLLGDQVCPADFYDVDQGKLFDAIQMLHDAGQPINDATVLVSKLRQQGLLEAIGGVAFLYGLLSDGTAQDAPRDLLRGKREAGGDTPKATRHGDGVGPGVYEPKADPLSIGQWLDAQLSGIGQRASHSVRTIGEVAAEVVDDLKRPESRAGNVFTGLREYDEINGGWLPGELVILAARPKMGKTALATQVALYQAVGNRPTLFVSLEMRRPGVDNPRSLRLCRCQFTQGADKAIGRPAHQGVGIRCGRHGRLAVERLVPAAGHAAGDPRGCEAGQGHRGAGSACRGLPVLGRPSDPKRPRHEQVAEVSAGLKSLAKELGVAVLCLAQLNREAEGEIPRLSNLRESGAVEQDADIVLFIHRNRKGEGEDTGTTKLITAAHRSGAEGELELRWVPRADAVRGAGPVLTEKIPHRA